MCFFAWWPCELLGPLGASIRSLMRKWNMGSRPQGRWELKIYLTERLFCWGDLIRHSILNSLSGARSEVPKGGLSPFEVTKAGRQYSHHHHHGGRHHLHRQLCQPNWLLWNYSGFEMAVLRKIGYSRRRGIGYTTSAAPRRLTPFCQNCEKFLEKTEMIWYFAWNFHLHCMLWHWVIKN